MASGYITSDGKDLDERYLGIDAKAKSAEVADMAARVENLVGATPILSKAQVPVTVAVTSKKASASWTAPDNGLFVGVIKMWAVDYGYGYLRLRGEEVYKLPAPSGLSESVSFNVNWALKAGDVIALSLAWTGTLSDALRIEGVFCPWDFLETSEE